jgi:hypothetical protein
MSTVIPPRNSAIKIGDAPDNFGYAGHIAAVPPKDRSFTRYGRHFSYAIKRFSKMIALEVQRQI